MKTGVTFDYGKAPQGKAVKVRALVKIEAERPRNEARRPLKLGVVLDRSGSMNGAKIHNVREATKALARKLGGDDVFSLTIFDEVIDTIIPPMRMEGGLGKLEGIVDAIAARGNTNLCDGYKKGCENVLKSAQPEKASGALQRVILLTDGLANVGVTDPQEIARIAREMAEKGIVTSTLGVGVDYSEDLLGRMAEAGGGNTYFLPGPAELEAVLSEELGCLFTLAVQRLKVRFEPSAKGVTAAQLNAYRSETEGVWILGDVYGGNCKSVVLEVEVPPLPPGRKVRIGELHLSGERTRNGEWKEFSEVLPLVLDIVPEEEFAAQKVNLEVALQAIGLIVAAARAKAGELAQRQDFEGAARALKDCANGLEQMGISAPEIAAHLELLRMEASQMEHGREAYYTSTMHKDWYTEYYLAGRGKFSHLENMRARRSSRGTSGGVHAFRLDQVEGRFLAQIGVDRFLVDTGCPTSIGDRSPLVLGSRSFDVKSGSISELRPQATGILGADILNQYEVVLDIRTRALVLAESPIPISGKVIPADFKSGLPILSAQAGGTTLGVLLRTGSRISFLKAGLADGGKIVGREKGVIPGFGDYDTELREVELLLGGIPYRLVMGTLPPALEDRLSSIGAAGILGADVFASRKLWMSARQGVVTISP
ncbi:MAG TPA: VWA domain-containing protein [Planctomycetota bacterium]|jgi:Mg-chelatase subunit ChlD|nr:VWA domain-containing protein [Planctomycetota bacterium]